MTIYATSLLGGAVTPGMAWSNDYGDTQFHEVGALWRVSFTPTEAKTYRIMAAPKIKMGDGTGKVRLYCKVRVVRISPTYANDLAFYSEHNREFTSGLIRFDESSRTIFAHDTVPPEEVGVPRVYGVEMLAGDGLHGEINYGSPMEISD